MQKFKNIALIAFVSFLFLGVCGISISEHLCTVTEKVCDMHEDHEQAVMVKHDCCEVPNKTNEGDCCKEETKVFQTALNHYHDVLVKLSVPYLVTLPTFDNYLASNTEAREIVQYYPNPPPLARGHQRARLQVYIL